MVPKGDVELVPLATVNTKASSSNQPQHHPSNDRRNALHNLLTASSYRCIVLVLFVAVIILSLNQTPADATFEFIISKTDESRSLQIHECQLFLAPSSLSNGLAIFTTKDIPAQERFESRDICVPQPRHEKRYQQQGNADYDAVQYQGMSIEKLLLHFCSTVSSLSFSFYPDTKECQGFAALLSPVSNRRFATSTWEPPIPDSGGLHRARDPAAGAITNLFGATIHSQLKTPAGKSNV